MPALHHLPHTAQKRVNIAQSVKYGRLAVKLLHLPGEIRDLRDEDEWPTLQGDGDDGGDEAEPAHQAAQLVGVLVPTQARYKFSCVESIFSDLQSLQIHNGGILTQLFSRAFPLGVSSETLSSGTSLDRNYISDLHRILTKNPLDSRKLSRMDLLSSLELFQLNH